MRYMLDTQIWVYLIKRRPTSVVKALLKHQGAGVGASVMTVCELEFGVAKSRSEKNAAALAAFLQPLAVADFDAAAARRYGQLRAELEAAGTPIGPLDLQTAAHALALGVTLVSNHTREFARVPGLMLTNWLQ